LQEKKILKLWEGLGYYRRAKNLHKTSKILIKKYNGQIPKSFAKLKELPGIGDYTANVLLALIYNQSRVALDGNVKRVLTRLFKVNIPVFWGGPVDVKEIFILHSTEYQSETTKKYGNISISQDYNILFDIAENKGPKKSLVVFGYSGWGSGQLEGEMERDHWILSDIDLDITFDKESNTKWNEAFKNSFIKV